MKRNTWLTLMVMACLASQGGVCAADVVPLKVITPQSASMAQSENSLDAVVEAVRQTTLSTQVAGAVVALHVKAGDRVKAGQELLRIDARAAQQNVIGASAQVEAEEGSVPRYTRTSPLEVTNTAMSSIPYPASIVQLSMVIR